MKFPPVRVFVSFFLLWLPSSVLFAQPQISVALVLDESGSINSANFALEQEGFRRAVTQLPADGSIEISVVYFSTGVNVRLSPTPLTAPNLGTIIAALSKSQSPGGTNMSAAINTAAQVLGGSSASTRILCLSTDGQPNSPSATISAASAARAAGILLDPVGIGLSGSGAALLNSIASHPPVANPGNFTEFGTVIVNKIGAGVGGALNILLSPDPLDFGVFNPNSLADCAKEKSLTIQNRGDTAATVLNIAVVGEDASAFQLVGIGPDLPIVTPFPLPPRFSTSLTVQFSAASAPPDDSFDARVELTAENDAGQVEVFSADLVASLDDDAAACLSLDVTDSYPLLTRISPSGATFTEDGALTEQAVFERLDSLFGFSLRRDRRQGFVADGNARLFLRALTNETSGTIRFQLTGAATSGALLYPLNRTTNQDSDGRIILDVAVSEMEPNIGQATAILRAPEDFPGADSEPESLFEVTACLLETGGCSPIEVRQTLRVRRTPVVLIHGLWSDGRAWSLDPSGKPGMKPGLEAGHFATGLFSYPGSSGPSVVMRPNSPMLPLMIDALCRTQRRADLACSRADIVAHSMGGLVARKFVHDNERYLSDWNFEQGAIRRIHTLGTPYNGSPLANLLLRDNAAVNNCLVDTDPDEDGIQNFNLTLAIAGLTVYGNSVDTAIRDLQVGSPLLETLRDPARKAPTGIQYGNAGEQFDPSLAPLLGLLRDAGCDYDEIFGEESDGIAGLSSLLARNFPAQQSVGLFHTEMTHNATTIQTTLQRLNGPRLGNFASQLTFPAPQPNSPSQNLASSAPVFKAAPPPVKVSLSLTVNDPTPSPGTVVTFQVAGAGPGVSELTLRSEDGSFLETDTSAPFSWQISVPDEASGSLEFQALGVDDDAIVLSNPVVVTVVPDLTAIRQVDFQQVGS